MKKAIIVLVMMLVCTSAWARYDFMLTLESGQDIYLQLNEDSVSVSVVYPGTSSYYYVGFNEPVGDMVIPDTVSYQGHRYAIKAIKNRAFSDCSGLTSVVLPGSIVSIGSYSLAGCTGLRNVRFNEGLVTMANCAFRGCTGLSSIVLPNTLRVVGTNAFAECEALVEVVFGTNANSIGEGIFSGCSHLTSVSLNDNLGSVSANMFSGCNRLQNIVIPASVTSIGDYAFDGCTRLQTIELHEGIREVGSYAFYHCSNLYTITLPNSVQTIGDNAFYYCEKLTEVYLGYGVESIGEHCFDYCQRLNKLAIKALTPPLLGGSALGGVDDNKSIYVPCGHLSDYQRAIVWRSYSDQMIENCGVLDIDPIEVPITIYQQGNAIVILGAEGQKISVFDIMGRMVKTLVAKEREQITVGQRGIYVVRCGNQSGKKIIVR